MQLTQIQNEVIGAAHSEGQVEPITFAGLLLLDLDDVHAAINDLVNRGLVAAAEGDTFRLTDRGEAVHQAQEDAHRDDMVSRTPTWQRH